MTFGERVIDFYHALTPPKPLANGVEYLNPYAAASVQEAVVLFYKKFFNDTDKRVFLIGINPGRFGAGATGIPFTDSESLRMCGIPNDIPETRELSAEFIHRLIEAYGGPNLFYSHFFPTNICPLGFIKDGVNFNYYDNTACMQILEPYIHETFKKQKCFGAQRVAIVLGKGKNYAAISKMNKTHQWFDELLPVEHPRFIIQYRRNREDQYRRQYLEALSSALQSGR